MLNKKPKDYHRSLIDWNVLQIIENNNLISKYFMSWTLLKYNYSDLCFQVQKKNSEIVLRGYGKIIEVGNFFIKDDKIEYCINNNTIKDNYFFNFLIQSLEGKNLDAALNIYINFFGNIRFRLSSYQTYNEGASIVCRILTQNNINKTEHLLFLLSNIDSLDECVKEEINSIYYSITNQKIDFQKNLCEPINLLKSQLEINEIIIY